MSCIPLGPEYGTDERFRFRWWRSSASVDIISNAGILTRANPIPKGGHIGALRTYGALSPTVGASDDFAKSCLCGQGCKGYWWSNSALSIPNCARPDVRIFARRSTEILPGRDEKHTPDCDGWVFSGECTSFENNRCLLPRHIHNFINFLFEDIL